MLDKGKCVSPSKVSENAAGSVSLRRAARLGTMAIALGAMMVLALAVSVSTASAKGAGNEDLGAKTFKTTCVMCHGEDGTGTPTGKALKAPDLHSDAVQKMTEAQIAEQISNGKNSMPPFKSTLSKEQIQALAKYVHTFGKKHK
jgi:mono/diheme cytochrome c family protein